MIVKNFVEILLPDTYTPVRHLHTIFYKTINALHRSVNTNKNGMKRNESFLVNQQENKKSVSLLSVPEYQRHL